MIARAAFSGAFSRSMQLSNIAHLALFKCARLLRASALDVNYRTAPMQPLLGRSRYCTAFCPGNFRGPARLRVLCTTMFRCNRGVFRIISSHQRRVKARAVVFDRTLGGAARGPGTPLAACCGALYELLAQLFVRGHSHCLLCSRRIGVDAISTQSNLALVVNCVRK